MAAVGMGTVFSIVRIVPDRAQYEHTVRVVGAFADAVRALPGCEAAQILRCVSSPWELIYTESWRDPEHFERHLGSPEYDLILGLVEASSEPPRVEYHLVSDTRGLEWVESLREVGSSPVEWKEPLRDPRVGLPHESAGRRPGRRVTRIHPR